MWSKPQLPSPITYKCTARLWQDITLPVAFPHSPLCCVLLLLPAIGQPTAHGVQGVQAALPALYAVLEQSAVCLFERDVDVTPIP